MITNLERPELDRERPEVVGEGEGDSRGDPTGERPPTFCMSTVRWGWDGFPRGDLPLGEDARTGAPVGTVREELLEEVDDVDEVDEAEDETPLETAPVEGTAETVEVATEEPPLEGIAAAAAEAAPAVAAVGGLILGATGSLGTAAAAAAGAGAAGLGTATGAAWAAGEAVAGF